MMGKKNTVNIGMGRGQDKKERDQKAEAGIIMVFSIIDEFIITINFNFLYTTAYAGICFRN